MADYQWYPGHMTKARRMMQENIRLVDLVIELADARIPISSRNPDIDSLCEGKQRILLLSKADLADPVRTQAFVEYYKSQGIPAIALDSRSGRANDQIRRFVQETCKEKLERDRRRGIIGRPLRAMVAGIPNSGKSTFINSFSGKASTKTGNKPGVTRGKQWIRLNKELELLDTPGILWPKFDDPEVGIRLALTGAIRGELLDEQELSLWLIRFLESEYKGILREKYEDAAKTDADGQAVLWNPEVTDAAMLEQIAVHRNLLAAGGEVDYFRASKLILDDFRNGKTGRITLEDPRTAAEVEARLKAAVDARLEEEAAAEKKAAAKKAAAARKAQARREQADGNSGRSAGGSNAGNRQAGRRSAGAKSYSGKNGKSFAKNDKRRTNGNKKSGPSFRGKRK